MLPRLELPIAAPFTDSSPLTVTFTSGGTTPVGPTDKIVAAANRTGAVTFAGGTGFSYDGGTPPDTEGVWSYDSVKNQASFTPNSGTTVAGPVKIAAYRLDPTGTTAKLVALFPAPQLLFRMDDLGRVRAGGAPVGVRMDRTAVARPDPLLPS